MGKIMNQKEDMKKYKYEGNPEPKKQLQQQQQNKKRKNKNKKRLNKVKKFYQQIRQSPYCICTVSHRCLYKDSVRLFEH